MFFLDKTFKYIIVRRNGQEKNIPLVDVVEVYSYEDLKEHIPEPQIVQLAGDLLESKSLNQDCSKAVFIQHRGIQGSNFPENWLCLLADDAASQERFTTSLNILRLYAQGSARSQAQ